jgi:type II secretion system protein N
MIAKKQVAPDVLEDQIYSNEGFPHLKILVIGSLMFLLGILLNFSLQKNIKNRIVSALASSPTCPIQYNDLGVKLFLPEIQLSKITIPGSCFQSREGSLNFDSINLFMSGISFYPIGLKFDVDVFSELADFKSTLSLGLPSPMFKIHNSSLDMKLINTLIDRVGLLKGELVLEAQGKLDGSFVEQMNLVIQARKFSMPSQSINGLKLPTLNFGKAAGKIRLVDQNRINLDEFVLGNDNSPIIGKLNGQVRLDQTNINSSQLDLNAHLKFAPSFIESFPILNFFLNNKEKTEDDFYKIQITGLLGSPNVQ